ncbi:3-phosphoshikimate 1-carboxyvinyltransferase [Thermodesulfobacterium hydrogeniphilum]|uniref:3-phosphoshikimate 1-carboxyvinyltransferase n=1 Tax=Thermodesulfobacterium hydrogeniphilum TaxID=161156 RepID=UPI000570F700|nr:3-phosphoshikimate 1-carboxyvinyltransferase [Thermodesulfobacterium hydrogeniphilum]
MNYKEIKALKFFKKAIFKLPSSKSLTQRALICASLADGTSEVINPLISEDTLLLKQALQETGVEIKEKNEKWIIKGIFPPLLQEKKIYLGNNGTGSRFFLAFSTLGKGSYIEIYGKSRLHERPVAPLIQALRELSAQIECLEKEGYFPVKVKESGLISKKLNILGNISSQFVSALILIAPYLPEGLELKIEKELISKSYVNMTLNVMKAFGIEVVTDKDLKHFKVPAGSYNATNYEIEADASSASYFLALPLILGKGEIIVENYNANSKQGDVKFLEYIKKMEAEIEVLSPVGVKVKFEGIPKGAEIDLGDTPDLFPTMCVLGAVAEGKTILKGAPHLRYKETDRIKAMVTELRKLGVKAEELPDGAIIEGTQNFNSAFINTYDDHRIAMSFAILGLKIGNLKIENPECVVKSFPDFWNYIERLYE